MSYSKKLKTKKPPYRPYRYKDEKFLQYYKANKEEFRKTIELIDKTGEAIISVNSHLEYYLKYLGYEITSI